MQMKKLIGALLVASILSGPVIAQPVPAPGGNGGTSSQTLAAYTLLNNVAVSGSTFANVVGGGYIFDLRGTIGGATVTVQVTNADGTFATFLTFTAAGTQGPISIGQGSSVKAIVTGGSPSGLYLTMQGIGSAVQAGTVGATPFTLKVAASTNATNIKASPGQITHVSGFTALAVPLWVTFYDTAGTPTCGTSIKAYALIPANSTNGGGFVEDNAQGVSFVTGIAMCVTTAIDGTGSPVVNSAVVNVDFK